MNFINIISCGILCLSLSGCAAMSQQNQSPPLPEWSNVGERWDVTGLTVSTYDSVPYHMTTQSFNANDPGLAGEIHNEMDLAEEAAYRRAQKLVLEEFVQLWLDYATTYKVEPTDQNIVRERIQKEMRGIFVNRRFFDAQRHIFHIQVYVTARRVTSIINSAFDVNVSLNNQGQLETAK